MSGPDAVTRLEELVEARLGLAPSRWQRERLTAIVQSQGPAGWAEAAMLRRVAEEITVGETYFFREPAQLDALVRSALPERARMGGTHPLRILSAGCSSGEEAYSIALAIELQAPHLAKRVSIHGVDVSAAAVRKAQKARYTPWALRATPPAIRDRFFRKEGDAFALDDAIRGRVRFEEHNLLEDDPASSREGPFDFVFCRNVLIYFTDRALRRAISRFAAIVPPGGFLFLGHSETLRGITDEFELEHVADAFYYRRKGGLPREERPSRPTPVPVPAQKKPSSAPPPPTTTWFEDIRRASERIAKLAEVRDPAPRPGAPSPPSDASRGASTLARALDLLEAERYDDALVAITAEDADTPELELCRAVIYGEKGRQREAERTLSQLIARGQCETGANYLLGLFRENERDLERAVWHYQQAAQGDARFALPHLRLGALLRRAGDTAQAQAELELARDLLAEERRDRIVLFGGGFRREVLLELCKAQLDALRSGS
jgi:chemotaxis protein methyltransferase CheR